MNLGISLGWLFELVLVLVHVGLNLASCISGISVESSCDSFKALCPPGKLMAAVRTT